MLLLSVLMSSILPILAIAGIGYFIGYLWNIDVEPLNTVTLNILVPALVFHSIATSKLSGTSTGYIIIGVLIFIVVMIFSAEAIGRSLGMSEPLLSAFVLICVFPNSGNFGIPLSELAFGSTGRTTAVLFVSIQNILVFTGGVYILSRGLGRNSSEAVYDVLKLPLLYAAIAAFVAKWTNFISFIEPSFLQTIKLVGNAAIPLMLIILGIKLVEMDVKSYRRVLTPTLIKLGFAPLVGIGVVLWLGFDNQIVARTFVLETAAPSAVLPLILTIEYSKGQSQESDDLTAEDFISAAIFITTIGSILFLTILIAVLKSGVII